MWRASNVGSRSSSMFVAEELQWFCGVIVFGMRLLEAKGGHVQTTCSGGWADMGLRSRGRLNAASSIIGRVNRDVIGVHYPPQSGSKSIDGELS